MFKVIVKVEDVRFRTTFQSQIDIFSLKTDSIVPSSFLPELPRCFDAPFAAFTSDS